MAFMLLYGQMAGPDVRNTALPAGWGTNPFYSSTPDARAAAGCARPRDAAHRGRSAPHAAGRAGPPAPAAAARHRRRSRPGLRPRDPRGGPRGRRLPRGLGARPRRVPRVRRRLRPGDGWRASPACRRRSSAPPPGCTRPQAGGADERRGAWCHHTNGVQNDRAVFALIGLTGNWDVAGGNRPRRTAGWRSPAAGSSTRQREFELPRAVGRAAAARGRRPLPRLGRPHRPGPEHGPAPPDPQRRPVPAARHGRLRPEPPHVPRLRRVPGGHAAARLHLRRRPVRDRHVAVRGHRASRLQFVERSEVRVYPQKYVVATRPVIEPLGEARPTPTSCSAWPTGWAWTTRCSNPWGGGRPAAAADAAAAASRRSPPSTRPWTGSSRRAA